MKAKGRNTLLGAYAMAEIQWPMELGCYPQQGRFCTPAHFESDSQSDWSLFVWLDKPAQAGVSVIVPIMPLVPDAGEELLKPEAQFRLFLGSGLFAHGRVVSVIRASEDDLKCVFHFC